MQAFGVGIALPTVARPSADLLALAAQVPSPAAAAAPSDDTVALSCARQAGGAIGAATGAAVGRVLLPTGAAIGAGALARLALSAALPALPAPIGIGLAAVAGLAAGVTLEAKTRAGRLVGGMAGGVAGSAVGAVAGAAGWQPSDALGKLASHFTVSALPHKLLDRDYFGYPRLRYNVEAVEAVKNALPGDILCVHHENYFEGAAVGTKLLGARADYTHPGLVTNRGTVIDMVETGAHERDKKAWLAFTHIAVLRPRYKSADSLWNTVEGARRAISEKTYDEKFSLTNEPEKEYCTEFVANRLKENAPEVHVSEQKWFGFRFITPDVLFDSPDIDVVYNSGSNFWLNHLSRFCWSRSATESSGRDT